MNDICLLLPKGIPPVEATAFLYSYYFKKFGIFAIIFLDSWKKKGDFSPFFIKMNDRNSKNTELRVTAGQGGRV